MNIEISMDICNIKLASLQDSATCTFDVLPKCRPSGTEKYFVHMFTWSYYDVYDKAPIGAAVW